MNKVRITIFEPALQTKVSFVRITQWRSRASGQTQRTWEPGYDRADQLSGVSENADTRYTYRYDKSGNRLSEQIAQRIAAAVYNNTNQLTKVTPGGPYRIEGTVDEPADITVNGVNASVDTQNRFRADVPLEPGQREIEVKATDGSGNTATRRYQLTVEANGQPRTLTYDLDGNLLGDGAGKTYTWDVLNRLIKITFATPESGQPNVIEFAYDGFGQRTQESHDGVVVKRWLWAGGYQPAEKRDADNRVTKRYYAGIGEQTVATNNTTTNYYYTTDHLGSVRELIDAGGNIRARYDYNPFGRRSKVQGDLDAAFGFTGHLYHTESKLNLTYYRAYDPALGRWLSRDPIAERGGLNLYAYCRNDPINTCDPLGLVDLNFTPTTDKVGWQRVEDFPSKRGEFTIGMHGDGKNFIDSSGRPIPIKDLADKIRGHPKWKDGMPVRTIVCKAGMGDDSPAQKLADELGSKVKAPDEYLWLGDNAKKGESTIWPATMVDGKLVPTEKGPAGTWRTFKPTKKLSK